MSIKEMAPRVTLGLIRYNPETGCFEAHAQLKEANACFTYRVSVKELPHAEFETVVRGLKLQTLRHHQDAKEKTQKLIRQTVRTAMARAKTNAILLA